MCHEGPVPFNGPATGEKPVFSEENGFPGISMANISDLFRSLPRRARRRQEPSPLEPRGAETGPGLEGVIRGDLATGPAGPQAEAVLTLLEQVQLNRDARLPQRQDEEQAV